MSDAQTSASRDPAHMAPRDVLQVAVGREKAIRCVAAHGRVTTFMAAQGNVHDVVWTAKDRGDGKAAIVTETHVRNAVARCQPDVELIDEREVADGD